MLENRSDESRKYADLVNLSDRRHCDWTLEPRIMERRAN